MNNKVNFLRGTSAEYATVTKDNDTFYYTTDNGKLYLGDKEIGIETDNTSTTFSIESAAWTTLSAPFAGCGFSAEIAAEGVTAADFPDVYFDSASFEIAANSGIIAEAANGKIVLYAKTVPQAALSGSYFIRKGATE